MLSNRRFAQFTALGVVLLSSQEAVAQGRADGQGFWHMGDWGWRHMMFGGGVMMLLFWIIVIGIVVFALWFVRQRGSTAASPDKSALEILRERFARGEIEEDEFERRKKALEDNGNRA